MNDQLIKAMIEQKLKEMNEEQIPINDEEFKKCKESISIIKKQFEDIAKSQQLSKYDKETAIQDAVFQLASIVQQLEEKEYLVKRYIDYYKKERESNKIQIQKLAQFKAQLEYSCRELQSKNKEINQGNVQMKEANEKDRDSIIQNCEKSVKEFEDKIKEEEELSKKFELENLDLREQLKQKIQEHQENQQKSEQQRLEKDEESNISQEKLKEEYAKIEESAKEAIEIQKQNSESFKVCQEMKVQIVYYKDKIKEFEASLDKSQEFLDVVIKEIGKLGIKMKPFSEKKQELEKRANIGDTIIIEYLNINKQLQASVQQLNQEKEKQAAVCKKLQEEFITKSKQ